MVSHIILYHMFIMTTTYDLFVQEATTGIVLSDNEVYIARYHGANSLNLDQLYS